eukprot:10062179-Alexandrium_andersonii.AAC.1
MREGLQRGRYERGVSPWGSWAFPTRPGRHKGRVVVGYRKVNQWTVGAVYALQRSGDVKGEGTGRVFYLHSPRRGVGVQPGGERPQGGE